MSAPAPPAEAAPPAAQGEKEEAPIDPEVQRKFNLLREVGEECQTEAELLNLIQKKPNFRLYDGFEPSGRMHVAQGIFKAHNVNRCTEAGGEFVFWIADWFALMNNKMGGDLKKIQLVGEYLKKAWGAVGMNMDKVVFRWSSEDIVSEPEKYWVKVLDISKRFPLSRIKKCGQIMGRNNDSLCASQILYPIMQCADIFYLQADICQLGVDQRKVNMLAREYCGFIGQKMKPIILSHHMVYGLLGQPKASKSNPDSAIFMEDSCENVRRKLLQACCLTKSQQASGEAPEGEPEDKEESMHLVEGELQNPVLDLAKCIVMHQLPAKNFVLYKMPEGAEMPPRKPSPEFTLLAEPQHPPVTAESDVEREYSDYSELENDWNEGKISELALKESLAFQMNQIIQPVRDHFSGEDKAMLDQIREWQEQQKAGTLPVVGGSTEGEEGERFIVRLSLPLKGKDEDKLSLEQLMRPVLGLRKAPAGMKSVLLVPDWTAFVMGCFAGKKADNKAELKKNHTYFKKVVDSVKRMVDTEFDVLFQSDLVKEYPSDYWVNAINVGRRANLDVVSSFSPSTEDKDKAGTIVGGLMAASDVFTMKGRNVWMPTCSSDLAIGEYLIGEAKGSDPLFGASRVVLAEGATAEAMKRFDLSTVEGTPNGTIWMAEEPQIGGKLKKAFCEPSNVEKNPLIDLIANFVIPLEGQVVITGKDKTETTFSSRAELDAAFAEDDNIRPQELKDFMKAKFSPTKGFLPAKK